MSQCEGGIKVTFSLMNELNALLEGSLEDWFGRRSREGRDLDDGGGF